MGTNLSVDSSELKSPWRSFWSLFLLAKLLGAISAAQRNWPHSRGGNGFLSPLRYWSFHFPVQNCFHIYIIWRWRYMISVNSSLQQSLYEAKNQVAESCPEHHLRVRLCRRAWHLPTHLTRPRIAPSIHWMVLFHCNLLQYTWEVTNEPEGRMRSPAGLSPLNVLPHVLSHVRYTMIPSFDHCSLGGVWRTFKEFEVQKERWVKGRRQYI